MPSGSLLSAGCSSLARTPRVRSRLTACVILMDWRGDRVHMVNCSSACRRDGREAEGGGLLNARVRLV